MTEERKGDVEMAYVALYRKFRPETFAEVKGQDAIVTTLKNQMIHDRIGHAYLFCGTRGTGKTSVAKLLAKAVNCENPQDGSPCGECESCRRIAAGNAMNVVEIDAASNNGVDNVREINERVQYPPAEGKKLVYIIDEVHMLSMSAFNALLKTLEEPPAYVLFILATTELHKVPITIKSRCQRYDFRRIPYGVIADRMRTILTAEGSDATQEALEYVARAADGSMRDALSLLDQCMSYHPDEQLTLDMALDAIGAVDVDLFLRLEKGVVADDTVGVMDLISEVVWRGTELTRFTEDFCMFLRNILFLKLSPELGKTLDMTAENVEALRALGEKLTEDTLQYEIRVLQELLQELRLSTMKRITLEMGILRLMRPECDTDLTGVIARLDRLEGRADKAESGLSGLMELEKKIDNGMLVQAVQQSEAAPEEKSPERTPEEQEKLIRESFPPAKAEEILQLAQDWNRKIIPQLPQPIRGYLQNVASVRPKLNQEQEAIGLILLVQMNQGGAADAYFQNPEKLERLEEEIGRIVGFRVNLTVEDDRNAAVRRDGMPDLSKIHFPGVEIVD
ncbi:MAG: DNA polymerase III subunit gamma/tau [Eubacterium sp.]|nr:DNA polymerase III subunit gamma/tau [Eubacterium sp.]